MRGAVLYSKERGSMREETEKEYYEWQMAKAREATTFPIMFSILFIRWEKKRRKLLDTELKGAGLCNWLMTRGSSRVNTNHENDGRVSGDI